MTTNHPLKLSLIVACLMAASSTFAADASKLTREEYKAAKDKISADYKVDKAVCDKLTDNAKDVCDKQAKAKEKVALAELEYNRSGSDRDRVKLANVKAEQEYAVAKEKCDDQTGDAKNICQKEAKAAEARAKAEIKADKKVAATTH